MITAVKILPELRTSRGYIHLQNKTFTLLTGFLLIVLTFDLDVVQKDEDDGRYGRADAEGEQVL